MRLSLAMTALLLAFPAALRAIEHRVATGVFALVERATRVLEVRVLSRSPDGWLYLVCEEGIANARPGELLVQHLPRRMVHGASLELFEPGLHYLVFLGEGPEGWRFLGGSRGIIQVQPHLSDLVLALRAWVQEPRSTRVDRLVEMAVNAKGRAAEDATWALCQRAADLREHHLRRLGARLSAAPPGAFARALVEAIAASPASSAREELLEYALHSAEEPPNLPRLARILRAQFPDLEQRLNACEATHPGASARLRERWGRIRLIARDAPRSLPGAPGGGR